MIKKIALITLATTVFSACTITPVATVTPINLTGKEKTGTACRFLGLGDGSVNKAAENGKIKTVKVVNQSLLPLTVCTEVVGD
jgi:hypothetical protein